MLEQSVRYSDQGVGGAFVGELQDDLDTFKDVKKTGKLSTLYQSLVAFDATVCFSFRRTNLTGSHKYTLYSRAIIMLT